MRLCSRIKPHRGVLLLISLAAISGLIVPDASAQVAGVQEEIATAKDAYMHGQYDDAEAHYKKAIALGDKLPEASKVNLWTNLGAVLREAHKYDASDAAFTKAIVIAACARQSHTQNYSNTLKQYAVLFRRMHKPEKAEEMETLAVQALRPDASTVRREVAVTTARPVKQPINDTLDPSTISSQPPAGTVELTMPQLMAFADRDPNNTELARFVAVTLYRKRDYEHSAIYTQRAATADPNSSPLQMLLSICYRELDRYDEAVTAAKRAMAISPTPDTYSNLISIYADAADMGNQMKALQDYVARFPGDAKVPEYQITMRHLQKATVQSEETALGAPTAEERKLCWKDRAPGPIKIFLVDNSAPGMTLKMKDGSNPKRPGDLVQEAFDSWSSASHGKIVFEKASDTASAQIVIGFAFSTDAVLSENCAAGVTRWENGGRRAIIHIGLVTTEGHNIERERFYATTLHEIGHALGLEHSKGSQDVMFWQEHKVQPTGLSRTDQQRILNLYDG